MPPPWPRHLAIVKRTSTRTDVTIAIVMGVIAGVAILIAAFLVLRYLRGDVSAEPPLSKALPSVPVSKDTKDLPPITYPALEEPVRPTFTTHRVQSFQRLLNAVKKRSILFNKNKPLPPNPEDLVYGSGEGMEGQGLSMPFMLQRPLDDTLKSKQTLPEETALSYRLPKMESAAFSIPPMILRTSDERDEDSTSELPYQSEQPAFPRAVSSSPSSVDTSFGLDRIASHPYGPQAILSSTRAAEETYNKRMTDLTDFSYGRADWLSRPGSPAGLEEPTQSVPRLTIPIPTPAPPPPLVLSRKGEIKYKRLPRKPPNLSTNQRSTTLSQLLEPPTPLEKSPPPEGGFAISTMDQSPSDSNRRSRQQPISVDGPNVPPSRLPLKTSRRNQQASMGSFDLASYYRFSSTAPRPPPLYTQAERT